MRHRPSSFSVSADVALVILRLSDSFGDFWPLLGRELDVPLVEWRPGEVESLPPGAAVVLIAAGGAEPDLPASLRALSLPSDIPIAAVGSATSHRLPPPPWPPGGGGVVS